VELRRGFERRQASQVVVMARGRFRVLTATEATGPRWDGGVHGRSLPWKEEEIRQEGGHQLGFL